MGCCFVCGFRKGWLKHLSLMKHSRDFVPFPTLYMHMCTYTYNNAALEVPTSPWEISSRRFRHRKLRVVGFRPISPLTISSFLTKIYATNLWWRSTSIGRWPRSG